MKDILGLRHLVRATGYSMCGIKDAFCSGCAFRQEIVFGVIQLIAICVIRESALVKMGLVALWIILLATELINSAVESVVDLVSPNRNELAKRAKDYCSAAVGLVVVLIALTWVVVIVRQIELAL